MNLLTRLFTPQQPTPSDLGRALSQCDRKSEHWKVRAKLNELRRELGMPEYRP